MTGTKGTHSLSYQLRATVSVSSIFRMENMHGLKRVNNRHQSRQEILSWLSKEHKLSAKMPLHSEACSIMAAHVKIRTSVNHNCAKIIYAMVSTKGRRVLLMKTVMRCFSVRRVKHGHGPLSAKT